jgi:prepilin-type N-terminal cleavage/methylation domain-containing protein
MTPQFGSFLSPQASAKRLRAFSLIELLLVMSIMLLIAGASVFGLVGGSNARNLDIAGNKVADLVNEARQNSIANRVMTALVLITPDSDPRSNAAIDNRLFLIEQFDQESSTWQPVSQWELLPDGVVVDLSDSATFTKLPSLLMPPTSLSYQGNPLNPTAYQVFLPDGHLAGAGQTPALRLVSGNANGHSTAYTSSTTAGVPHNYYDITINPYTGMPIIDRP